MPEPSDARAYLRPLLHRWPWLLAGVIIATAATYVWSSSRPNEYTAGTTLFLSETDNAGLVGATPAVAGTDRNATNQAKLIDSALVMNLAAARLRLHSPDELRGATSVTTQSGSDFISITARASTPAFAAEEANVLARSYVDARAQQARRDVQDSILSTKRQMLALPAGLPSGDPRRARREQLAAQLEQLRALSAAVPKGVSITERASPPGVPSSPRPKRDALFAFAIALVGGIALAFGLERFDRRIRTVDEVSQAYRYPVMAVVPHGDDPGALSGPEIVLPAPLQESFRSLRTSIRLASVDAPVRTLIVTSAGPGEGKSTVVRNLAIAYREWGLRTLIVEMDLRRPTMAKLCNVEPAGGLVDVLSGDISLEDAITPIPVKIEGLHTLAKIESRMAAADSGMRAPIEARWSEADETTSGLGFGLLAAGTRPPNPESVLATAQIRKLLEDLRSEWDIVIVDTAPVLAVSDAVPLIGVVDGVIVVSRLGLSTRDQGRRLYELFSIIPSAKVLGVAANDLPKIEQGYGYGYGYE
jgi:Mrp family chromosome partitioning ATPase/capsular polysaccharide biosynthesis protein